MARKKKKTIDTISQPWSPSPTERRKYAAKDMARTMIETDPSHKKMENHIMSEVMKAGERAMHKGMGRKGEYK